MVYTLGESLLDIIITTPDNVVARPGGAMLNTSVSLGRSNIEVTLISELGDDDSSNLIIKFLKENNIHTNKLSQYPNNKTCLALAFLDKNKKPNYTFHKSYPSKRHFQQINELNPNDILLFGSLYSLDKEIRSEIKNIVENARRNNATVIYDPNIRNAHHLADSELIKAVYENISFSNIVKGSDEDFTNIFGISDIQMQISSIRKINNSALIIITRGNEGLIADYGGKQITMPAVKVEILSTIGAGDSFNAGIISALDLYNDDIVNTLNTKLELVLKQGILFSAQVCASMDNYIS